MKYIGSLMLLLAGMQAQAQFGIIQDKDGYTNVREGAGISRKIADKVANGEIVYTWEKQGEWFDINYRRNGEIQGGFVHNSRIKMIDSFDKIKVRQESTTNMVFQQDSVTVMFTTRPFVEKAHQIGHSKTDDGYPIVDKIDGKQFYGCDGGLPSREYNTFTIQIGNRAVVVPDKAIRDLYQPNPELTTVYYDRKNDRLYIAATNSDGAGSYEVLLQFDRGVYTRRAIFYGF
ncbi:SH3 domain-containing protein [Chitinophaga sp. G-6-1-13]|uniref:SH3 domain-containing protein n=1 Tax=Chitinophaga fulva TaxID=2728842 RepID=A0A848GG45_9BACT|nr:SH3 domain-containing protein [Chitinophaga fulva]NML37615.1 SH3 domain-containing protein [Chitinophaga fulva]